MSINSSSNSSVHSPPDECFNSVKALSTFIAYFISSTLLLLPVFILVLYFGYQQWRKQRSVAVAAKMSHSDAFTFNMVVLELIGVFGVSLYGYGTYGKQTNAMYRGMEISAMVTFGQTLFHLLTCVERYVAVVHPVTYMGLRQSGGVRIRNISIVCVWLLSFGLMYLSKVIIGFYNVIALLLLVVSSAVCFLCSLSVLCVLVRPGPGEVGGNREQVGQLKQRAFYTIVLILGALSLRSVCSQVATAMYNSSIYSGSDMCIVRSFELWFNLPSSLVLPLLFLHRAGKLPGCKLSTESG